MDPVYNERAVRPFLGRPSANPTMFFRGEAAYPNSLAQEDRNYYYHATTLGNIPGILERGLDPQRGGSGGAGQIIAAPRNPVVGAGFARRDAGAVYVADNPEIAVRYAFEYDDAADGFGQAPGNGDIRRSAVILRVSRESLERENVQLEEDGLEDPGAFRTHQQIIPSNLEILTEEGWTPLRDMRLRQEIYNNVNTALNPNWQPKELPQDPQDIREREEAEIRAHRTETSLAELSSEEGPRREDRTPPVKSGEKSKDKSADL